MPQTGIKIEIYLFLRLTALKQALKQLCLLMERKLTAQSALERSSKHMISIKILIKSLIWWKESFFY